MSCRLTGGRQCGDVRSELPNPEVGFSHHARRPGYFMSSEIGRHGFCAAAPYCARVAKVSSVRSTRA